MDISKLKVTPQDLCIFHVGGMGSYGPLDSILRRWPQRCVLVVFEAREGQGDEVFFPQVRSMSLNACVGAATGKATFYVMRHPEASSIFPPSPEAASWHIGAYLGQESPVDLWGEEAEVHHTTTLDVYSLHDLISYIGITPEVLSLDAQGAELAIIKGMDYFLRGVNVIVAETEFSEIYLGQPLFDHQAGFLREQGFSLVDIMSRQYWHPGPSAGEGFLTVGEALWFRKIDSFLSINYHNPHVVVQAVNLATVALVFQRYSYSYELLKRLVQTGLATLDEVERVSREAGAGVVAQLVKLMDDHLDEYAQNKHLFLRSLEIQDGPGHQG